MIFILREEFISYLGMGSNQWNMGLNLKSTVICRFQNMAGELQTRWIRAQHYRWNTTNNIASYSHYLRGVCER